MAVGADPASVAGALARSLERQSIPYAIGGALCLAYWGVPRATKDVDLNVFVGDDEIERVAEALEAAGCTVDRAEAARRARQRGDVVARHGTMRVDVFIAFHPFHQSARARAVRANLPDGTSARFLTAEDLFICKMLFHRAKDLVDVDRLLVANARFDIEYAERWLRDILGPDDGRVAETRQRFERAMGGGP